MVQIKLRYYSEIYMERLKKMKKNIRNDNQFNFLESN
jgi:hypothetical protein